MTGDDWQTLGQVTGYVLLGIVVTWKAHKAEVNAKAARVNSAAAKDNSATAADNSQLAKEFAEPTGNGFAKTVRDALACLQASAGEQKVATERIEARQTQDSGMLYSHIQSHANADVLKGAHRESASDPNSP